MVESLTNRWILTLGLATLCFGISLFVLRIPIRTIGIFFVLGIPLILLWLYAGDKSKQQQQQKEKIISDPKKDKKSTKLHLLLLFSYYFFLNFLYCEIACDAKVH